MEANANHRISLGRLETHTRIRVLYVFTRWFVVSYHDTLETATRINVKYIRAYITSVVYARSIFSYAWKRKRVILAVCLGIFICNQ